MVSKACRRQRDDNSRQTPFAHTELPLLSGTPLTKLHKMTGVDRTVDEEFLPLVEQCRKMFDELWALPLDKFKMGWATAPPALHSETPSISDILVSHKLVPVTDGSTVEIQIYSPKGQGSTPPPLLFVTHGGGWVVGTHAIEEVMNRSICVKNGCVVVSVDYRMYPNHMSTRI